MKISPRAWRNEMNINVNEIRNNFVEHRLGLTDIPCYMTFNQLNVPSIANRHFKWLFTRLMPINWLAAGSTLGQLVTHIASPFPQGPICENLRTKFCVHLCPSVASNLCLTLKTSPAPAIGHDGFLPFQRIVQVFPRSRLS